MKNLYLCCFCLFLVGCSAPSRYTSFSVNIPKQDPAPVKAVYTSTARISGPDGVCVYKNGKCDTSKYEFLVNDLRKAYGSDFLARQQAATILSKDEELFGCGYEFMDSNVKEHENEFETKSNNLVVNVFTLCGYAASHIIHATVYYKNQEIGTIKTNASLSNQDYVKRMLLDIAQCAATTGFNGTIGGERYYEDKPSPSIIKFFEQCGYDS